MLLKRIPTHLLTRTTCQLLYHRIYNCDVTAVGPVSSRQANDDCEDLSARSGGSGPLGAADDPALLLLFSSLVWQGWARLWSPSPPTETASGDGESKQ